MALDQARLKTSIRDLIVSKMGLTIFSDTELIKFCDAMSQAIYTEFTDHAELNNAVVANNSITGHADISGNVTGTITATSVTGGVK